METQFCKSCGQANFQNASVCTKCGQFLNLSNENKGSSNHLSHPAPKKSNKKFWIIGAAAVLLLFLGIAVIGIAGGAILYFSSDNYAKTNKPPVVEKTPEVKEEIDSKDTLDDINFPSFEDTDFPSKKTASVNDSALINFFKQKKPRVGKYKLDYTEGIGKGGAFPGKLAGAFARYVSGKKTIVHEISLYKALNIARRDFNGVKNYVRQKKLRVRTSSRDQIVYEKKDLVYLMFVNQQGGVHLISARNGKEIIYYYNSYFGRK